MFELFVRLLIAGLLPLAAALFGVIDFDLAWKAGLATAALAYFGQRLEARGFKNSGVAGFFAVADAFTVALILSSAHMLPTLGFLVLGPIAYGVRRHSVNALHAAPLAAGAILIAYAIQHGPSLPPKSVLFHMIGVLALGLLLSREKVVASIARPVTHEVHGTTSVPPDGFLELRENYRRLREAYADLQQRARRERTTASLADVWASAPQAFFTTLAAKLGEVCGLDRLVIYTVSGYDNSFIVRASRGDVPAEYSETGLDVDVRRAAALVREKASSAIAALGGNSSFTNVILSYQGRIVGLVTLLSDNTAVLSDAENVISESADEIAALVIEGARRQDMQRRLREAELLYELAALADGAASDAEIARRFARDLVETLGADHLAVTLLEADAPLLLAREGRDVRLIGEMSFALGQGLAGWVKTGAPELTLFDVRTDHRCPSAAALRSRVGSYLVMPVYDGGQIAGYVSAASSQIGGFDIGGSETLRMAAAELGRALFRFEGQGGIVGPADFRLSMEGKTGSLVVLDPLRRDAISSTFGRPALTHVLRRFARCVRARLPHGATLCRRPEGDLLVYMPGVGEEAATSWANEMAAAASMIGLRTPDGSNKIPFAVRAKVAVLGPQNHQISEELIA